MDSFMSSKLIDRGRKNCSVPVCMKFVFVDIRELIQFVIGHRIHSPSLPAGPRPRLGACCCEVERQAAVLAEAETAQTEAVGAVDQALGKIRSEVPDGLRVCAFADGTQWTDWIRSSEGCTGSREFGEVCGPCQWHSRRTVCTVHTVGVGRRMLSSQVARRLADLFHPAARA